MAAANDRTDDSTPILRWRSTLTPGDAAQLRRCRTVDQIRMQPSFVRLVLHLRSSDDVFRRDEDLAIAAALAASFPSPSTSVPEPDREPQQAPSHGADGRRAAVGALARAMATDKRVSDLRFRRLLRLQGFEYDERLASLRRLRHLIGDEVARPAVAEGLIRLALHWNDRTKRELATSYYQLLESTQGSTPALEA